MSPFFLFGFLFVDLLVCLATYFLFETAKAEMGLIFFLDRFLWILIYFLLFKDGHLVSL